MVGNQDFLLPERSDVSVSLLIPRFFGYFPENSFRNAGKIPEFFAGSQVKLSNHLYSKTYLSWNEAGFREGTLGRTCSSEIFVKVTLPILNLISHFQESTEVTSLLPSKIIYFSSLTRMKKNK